MKKIPIILNVIILSLIFTSCFDADYNNPNDKFSDIYIKDNAKLSDIVIFYGELSPAFNPDITVYTINLSYLVSSIIVRPIAVNNHSTININGFTIDSGDSSDSIYIDYGDKDILINVTSEDGINSITYTLKVTRYENNDNNFHAFNFLKVNNSILNSDIIGIIDTNNKTINLTIPYGTSSDLIATYNTGEFATVEIEGVQQESGVTKNNFSTSIKYTITAQNRTKNDYIIHVTIAPNTEKDFKTFYFQALNNSQYLSENAIGVIDTISATVKISLPVALLVDIPSLVVTFEVGDNASVYTDGSIQTSGVTANNFANPKTYTLIAQDNSTKNYIVTVVQGNHEAYLKSPNNSNNDYFGSSASIWGDTVVIGARRENSNTSLIINGSDLTLTDNNGLENGAAYVFKRTNGTWAHEAYLKAPNNNNNFRFGSSVAVENDTIVVGAFSERSTTTSIINGSDLSSTNNNGYNNGAAYVFNRTNNIWSHEAYLKAPNNYTYSGGVDSYFFGNSVSISGDTIAVGAYAEKSTTTSIINGSDLSSTTKYGNYRGAVYVFKRTDGIWSHEAYLKSPNSSEYDHFGNSVSISRDTIAVGAPYEQSRTRQIINGSDLSSTNDNGYYNGAVYIFKRSNNSWSFEAYLKSPNNTDNDQFGSSVAIDNDTIVVGAPNEGSTTTNIINGSDLSSTNDSGSNNGAIYIFRRYGNIWVHEAYLKAPNNSNGDNFGSSVSISNDSIAIRSTNENSTTTNIINGSDLSSSNNVGSSNGAVYVFKRNGFTWEHKAYLKAPNNSNADYFGSSVSISGNTIVVGSQYEDSTTSTIINSPNLNSTNDNGTNNGAAYIFH